MTAPIRIGVAGLGRAFTLMLPTFTADPRVRLVSGADPLQAARDQFTRDFGGPAFDAVERLCAQADVDVVYVATLHQLHAHHTALAFAHGKHVLLEKPMAITLNEGQPKSPADYAAERKRLDNAGDPAKEARLKAARNYGGAMHAPPAVTAPKAWNHFGFSSSAAIARICARRRKGLPWRRICWISRKLERSLAWLGMTKDGCRRTHFNELLALVPPRRGTPHAACRPFTR